MCIDEEIEMLESELAEIKEGVIDAYACDRLAELIDKCKASIKTLNKDVYGLSRLRVDYFECCKSQLRNIQNKAKKLIGLFYKSQTPVVEY